MHLRLTSHITEIECRVLSLDFSSCAVSYGLVTSFAIYYIKSLGRVRHLHSRVHFNGAQSV